VSVIAFPSLPPLSIDAFPHGICPTIDRLRLDAETRDESTLRLRRRSDRGAIADVGRRAWRVIKAAARRFFLETTRCGGPSASTTQNLF
jgi:hypothetical protein